MLDYVDRGRCSSLSLIFPRNLGRFECREGECWGSLRTLNAACIRTLPLSLKMKLKLDIYQWICPNASNPGLRKQRNLAEVIKR